MEEQRSGKGWRLEAKSFNYGGRGERTRWI